MLQFSDRKILLIILFFSFLIFYKSLFAFFVQDDFWLLSISQAGSFSDFFNFFKPLKEVAWYRPLSSQIFFFFSRMIFDLNPFFYHIISLITHLGVVYLIYHLTNRLTSQKNLSLLSAFIYGINQIHTVSLSWLATYSFVLGPLMVLLTLICYIEKKYFHAVVFFVLSLLTSEVSLMTALIIMAYQKIYGKKINITQLLPFIGFSACLLILRFVLFPAQISSSVYKLEVSVNLLQNLKFYFLRLIGVPLFFSQLPLFLKVVVVSSLIFLSTKVISIFFKREDPAMMVWMTNLKGIKFFLSIGLMYLLPFLLLTNHVSPYYLSFSLIGFAPIISFALLNSLQLNKFKSVTDNILYILFCFITLQVVGILSTYQMHWVFKRAEMAKRLIAEKKFIHPVGSEEYFASGANMAGNIFDN